MKRNDENDCFYSDWRIDEDDYSDAAKARDEEMKKTSHDMQNVQKDIKEDVNDIRKEIRNEKNQRR